MKVLGLDPVEKLTLIKKEQRPISIW